MRKLLALVLSSLLVATPAFADRTVYAPVRLAPTATAGTILFADGTEAAPSMSFSADTDTGIYRRSTNQVSFVTGGLARFTVAGYTAFIGNGATSATPAAGTLSGTSGVGTNIAGASLTFDAGASTGTGAGGSLIFRTSPPGSTGSAANTLTERMRITSDGEIGIGSSTATGNRLALTYTTASGVAKIGPNSTGGNTSLAFGTSASGTYADRMTITSAGNVGISTTTPNSYAFQGAPIFVVGDTANTYGTISIPTSTTGVGHIAFADGTSGTDRYAGLIEYAHTTDQMTFRTGANARWSIDSSGNLLQNSSTGLDIVLSRSDTSVRQKVATAISAAGSTSADPTALTSVYNIVSTVTAGQGVKLPAVSSGSTVFVVNNGANDLKLYPNTGGSINANATDVAITLAAATKEIATCFRYATNNWSCTKATAP